MTDSINSGRKSCPSTPSSSTSLDLGDYSTELECFRETEDLQVAGELGIQLLESNQRLVTSLKQYENLIEDQKKEVEYLTRRTEALKEVHDSSLCIHDELEVSIQELERTNVRLALENSADKKYIRRLRLTINCLESECEELKRNLDKVCARHVKKSDGSVTTANGESLTVTGGPTSRTTECDLKTKVSDSSNSEAEIIKLMGQIQELKEKNSRYQRKVGELEEKIAVITEENLSLEEKLNLMEQKEYYMKSLQEEYQILEEVRQGQLCRRCLRVVDKWDQDEISFVRNSEVDDECLVNSVTSETHCSTPLVQMQNMEVPQHDDLYRILVEKYESLLEVQRHLDIRQLSAANSSNCLSLQEELELSGNFNNCIGKSNVGCDPDPEPTEEKTKDYSKGTKCDGSTTPNDFSETEILSVPSDESSNKETLSEGHLAPSGSLNFPDDSSFNLYDYASLIESRFRNTPAYRQLLHKLYAVLKREEESKYKGEQLSLLEDSSHISDILTSPPAARAKEEQRKYSIPSRNKEECYPILLQNIPSTPVIETDEESKVFVNLEKKECSKERRKKKERKVHETQIKRARNNDHLKYIPNNVRIKTRLIKNNFAMRQYNFDERNGSPALVACNDGYQRDEGLTRTSHTISPRYDNAFVVQTDPSAASQEVEKLKERETSYLDVLTQTHNIVSNKTLKNLVICTIETICIIDQLFNRL